MVESLRGLTDSGTAPELREFLLNVSNRDWAGDETITLAPMTGETITEAG